MTWRDVQHIIVRSGLKNDPSHPSWMKNGAGHHVSDYYGFGVTHGESLMNAAEEYITVPTTSQRRLAFEKLDRNLLGDEPQEIKFQFESSSVSSPNNIRSLEHVEVKVNVITNSRRNLIIRLRSPMGTVSTLAKGRSQDTSYEGLKDWTLMTVQFWDENPVGEWTLSIWCDSTQLGTEAILENFSITWHGASCTAEEWKENNNKCQWEQAIQNHQDRRTAMVIGLAMLCAVLICAFLSIIIWMWYRYVRTKEPSGPKRGLYRSPTLEALTDEPLAEKPPKPSLAVQLREIISTPTREGFFPSPLTGAIPDSPMKSPKSPATLETPNDYNVSPRTPVETIFQEIERSVRDGQRMNDQSTPYRTTTQSNSLRSITTRKQATPPIPEVDTTVLASMGVDVGQLPSPVRSISPFSSGYTGSLSKSSTPRISSPLSIDTTRVGPNSIGSPKSPKSKARAVAGRMNKIEKSG